MTQEEKQLLLIELCARSPYGVTCQFTWTYCNETTDGEEVIEKENDNIRDIDIHTKEIRADYYDEWVDLENCKPYLRPLESMTEEEFQELHNICPHSTFNKTNDSGWIIGIDGSKYGRISRIDEISKLLDWLNKNMFDYRGLIPMGLALVAPEGMYKV